MSETRYAPEDLTLMADTLAFVMEEGSPEGLEMATDMLRQAAQDARVIEQLRAFCEQQRDLARNIGSLPTTDVSNSNTFLAGYAAFTAVLAELDRLAPPQRQE